MLFVKKLKRAKSMPDPYQPVWGAQDFNDKTTNQKIELTNEKG